MGFALNPTYAEPEKSSPASKKCVWEIFSESGEFALSNRLASKCLSRKNASIPTKTVSGRTVWLSRDPIAESGGLNLYGYVENNPINYFDPDGMKPKRRSPSAMKDFSEQYNNMLEANWKNSDKYFHCMANCKAAKRGHVKGAEQLSEAREWVDEHVKGDSPADCNADRAANDHGRDAGKKGKDCKTACAKYRPKGLPKKY